MNSPTALPPGARPPGDPELVPSDDTATILRDVVERSLLALAPEAELDTLYPRRSLRAQLDLDSFDFLHLMIALHQRLGVAVPEADYRAVDSLDGLLAYLAAHVNHGSAPPGSPPATA